MAEGRIGPSRMALATLQLAAVWATATARSLPGVWVLALPTVIALGLPDRHLPLVLLRSLARTARVVVGLMLAGGAVWVLYPLIPDALVARAGLYAGVLLLLLATCLGSGTGVLPSAQGALPAALGALLAATLEPRVALTGPLVLAAVATVVLLAAGAPGRPGARLAFTVFVAAGLATGFTHFLPWAQPYVENRVASAMSSGYSGITGFGANATLGDVASLAVSQRPALRVYAPLATKLRGRVFTRFDGHGWVTDEGPAVQAVAFARPVPARWPEVASGSWRVAPGPSPHDVSAADLKLTVVPAIDERQLFVPAHVLAARLTSPGLEWSALGTLRADASAAVYDLVAGLSSAEEACAACLELPPRLDPRLAALARAIAPPVSTPEERVARTLAHLQRTCRYTLSPGTFATRDPLAEFLFEKQRGYCEYFATSAAVLLRLEGLPTRYVKGFNVTAAQRTGDHYLVRESDAHAWIDVQLPGRGWVEVDPTPAEDFAELHAASGSRLAAVWERLAARMALLRLTLAGGGWHWVLLGALALALALVIGPRLMRRLRSGRSQTEAARARVSAGLRPELRALVRRFDEECAARGAPRPAARGLFEHLDLVDGARFSTAWRSAGRAAAECVYAEVYAGRLAAPQDLSALSVELRRGSPGDPRN